MCFFNAMSESAIRVAARYRRKTDVIEAWKSIMAEREPNKITKLKELYQYRLGEQMYNIPAYSHPHSIIIDESDGGRTAASAIGGKDVEIYTIMPKGAYKYDPAGHSLNLIAEGDHRPAAAGGQDFVNSVPVVLILVSDSELFNEPAKNYPGFDISPMVAGWSAMDAGIVTQNINLFCAGNGLATITREFMDKGALRQILKLSHTQELLLNNAVGYPEE